MRTILTALVLVLLAAAPGRAVLGEYENSVASDQQRMQAQLHQIAGPGYSIRQLTTADGREVREYVSPSGLVFGLSWQGPTMPDLRQLLGSYFDQLQRTAQTRRGRGPRVVRTDNFVFESSGHMRWFRGRAYVPGMLPSGVPAEVVQ